MVVFDATFLMRFLDPQLKDGGKNDPRVDHLVQTLYLSRDRIIVPTPALSEVLVGAGEAAPEYLNILSRSRYFRIEPFGTMAAVEAAAATSRALANGNKRAPSSDDSSWAKVKFDRQIVAIAKVVGATAIYSDDDDVAALGKAAGIHIVRLDDLPYPPQPPQIEMELAPREPRATAQDEEA